MGNYISSEHLKHKNTFAKKLVWLAPILTLFLNVLAPMWYQQNSYNWWYVLLYPSYLTLLSILIIQRDNGKLKFRAILSLPIDLKNMVCKNNYLYNIHCTCEYNFDGMQCRRWFYHSTNF